MISEVDTPSPYSKDHHDAETTQLSTKDTTSSIDYINNLVQERMQSSQQNLRMGHDEGRDDQNETQLAEPQVKAPLQEDARQGLPSSLFDLKKDLDQMKRIRTSFEHRRHGTPHLDELKPSPQTPASTNTEVKADMEKSPAAATSTDNYYSSTLNNFSRSSENIDTASNKMGRFPQGLKERAKTNHLAASRQEEPETDKEDMSQLAVVRKILSDAANGMNDKLVKSEEKAAFLQSVVKELEAKMKDRESTVAKLRESMEDAEDAIDYSKSKIDELTSLREENKKEIKRWKEYYNDKAIRLDKLTNESDSRIHALEEQVQSYSVELKKAQDESLERLELISEQQVGVEKASQERDELSKTRYLLTEELEAIKKHLEEAQAKLKASEITVMRLEETSSQRQRSLELKQLEIQKLQKELDEIKQEIQETKGEMDTVRSDLTQQVKAAIQSKEEAVEELTKKNDDMVNSMNEFLESQKQLEATMKEEAETTQEQLTFTSQELECAKAESEERAKKIKEQQDSILEYVDKIDTLISERDLIKEERTSTNMRLDDCLEQLHSSTEERKKSDKKIELQETHIQELLQKIQTITELKDAAIGERETLRRQLLVVMTHLKGTGFTDALTDEMKAPIQGKIQVVVQILENSCKGISMTADDEQSDLKRSLNALDESTRNAVEVLDMSCGDSKTSNAVMKQELVDKTREVSTLRKDLRQGHEKAYKEIKAYQEQVEALHSESVSRNEVVDEQEKKIKKLNKKLRSYAEKVEGMKLIEAEQAAAEEKKKLEAGDYIGNVLSQLDSSNSVIVRYNHEDEREMDLESQALTAALEKKFPESSKNMVQLRSELKQLLFSLHMSKMNTITKLRTQLQRSTAENATLKKDLVTRIRNNASDKAESTKMFESLERQYNYLGKFDELSHFENIVKEKDDMVANLESDLSTEKVRVATLQSEMMRRTEIIEKERYRSKDMLGASLRTLAKNMEEEVRLCRGELTKLERQNNERGRKIKEQEQMIKTLSENLCSVLVVDSSSIEVPLSGFASYIKEPHDIDFDVQDIWNEDERQKSARKRNEFSHLHQLEKRLLQGVDEEQQEEEAFGKIESLIKFVDDKGSEVAIHDALKNYDVSFNGEELSEWSESASDSDSDSASTFASNSDSDSGCDSFVDAGSPYSSGLLGNLLERADRLLFDQKEVDNRASFAESFESDLD